MSTTDMTATVLEPDAAGRTDLTCAVCSHALAAHDLIGTRFCSATAAGGFDRGCVCAKTSPTETARLN